MESERLVVLGDRDLEFRREFLTRTAAAIATSDGQIELDCSQIDALDGPTLGMLVAIARSAQRRGQLVVLDGSSARVRSEIDEAGVGGLFTWSV